MWVSPVQLCPCFYLYFHYYTCALDEPQLCTLNFALSLYICILGFNPSVLLVCAKLMLHWVSIEQLKKTALYGAVLSATGCSILYYLIQHKLVTLIRSRASTRSTSLPYPLLSGTFETSLYYKQSVLALKHHQLGCKLLGEPLQFQTIKLGDKQNWVTTEEVHVRPYIFLFIHKYYYCWDCNMYGSSLKHTHTCIFTQMILSTPQSFTWSLMYMSPQLQSSVGQQAQLLVPCMYVLLRCLTLTQCSGCACIPSNAKTHHIHRNNQQC